MSVLGTIAALATLAADIATVVSSIKQLRKGKNSPEIAKMVDALERQLRILMATRLKSMRRARRATRDASGKFA